MTVRRVALAAMLSLVVVSAATWGHHQDRTSPSDGSTATHGFIPSGSGRPDAGPSWRSSMTSSLKARMPESQATSSLAPVVPGPTAFIRPAPLTSPGVEAPVTRPRATTSAGNATSGRASWYCGRICTNGYPDGLWAAAGAELRTGDWRGRQVRVCAGGDCVRVRLIDWCRCPGTRIIDLYADAFSQLAPLGQGTVAVRVYVD